MEQPVGTIEQLMERLNSADEEVRRLAVVELARYPLAETKERVFAAMGDVSWRVRKEAVDILLASEVGTEELEELVDLLRSHDNAGLRNSAVETLERLGSRSLEVLSLHAGDDDHDVRKFVIDIMGNIGDDRSCPLLIKALEDADHNVSAAAAENLGKIGSPGAVPALVRALGRNDIWFRYTILEALSRIGKPVPMEVIAPLAAENLLKKAVFDCLGAIGDAESIPLLVEGLRQRVKSARDAAVLAIMKLRERLPAAEAERHLDSSLRELAGSPFVDGLLASMDTTDRVLQEALVRLLGIIGDERASSLLLHGCRDERLRRHCVQAFRTMGLSCATTLVSAFPNADDEERCFIVYLCGELGFRECTQILDEGMRDPNPVLRKISAQAAGKIGLVGLLGNIVRLLDDGNPEVREGVVEALSRLAAKDAEAVTKVALGLASADTPEKRRDAALLFASLADAERLSFLIKDEDVMVRKAAVQSLGALRSAESVGHLVMALVDEESDVRIAAADALGGIGGDEVIEPLLLTLKDDDPWVQCAAMKSLGSLKSGAALPAMKELMDASDGLVKITALETLAEIGGDQARDVVENALAEADEEVVKAAIGILSRNDDAWLEKHCRQLLVHPNWDVRSLMVRILADSWGEKAIPFLRSAYEAESDELVKGQISDILDRFQ
jgi:HEAT repeat protein